MPEMSEMKNIIAPYSDDIYEAAKARYSADKINNPALPAIHAFERWKYEPYLPVRKKIQIRNGKNNKEG